MMRASFLALFCVFAGASAHAECPELTFDQAAAEKLLVDDAYFAPLKPLERKKVTLVPCNKTQGTPELQLEYATPKGWARSKTQYTFSLAVPLFLDTGAPRRSAIVRRVVERAKELRGLIKKMEGDGAVRAFHKSYAVDAALYHFGGKKGDCLSLRAKATGKGDSTMHRASIRYCASGGVASYTVDALKGLKRKEAASLAKALKAAHPGSTVKWVSLTRRHANRLVSGWRAVGYVQLKDQARAEYFHAEPKDGGGWNVVVRKK